MQDFRVACIQSPPGGVVTAQYVDTILGSVGTVHLVVLPELCNVPYFPLETNSLDAASSTSLDAPCVEAFGEVATKYACYLLVGLYLSDGTARWNAAVLFNPDGRLLEGRTSQGGSTRIFKKIHLCDIQSDTARFCESAYFDPGYEYVIWDTELGSIAPLICYDRHFSEAWTSLMLMGAELVGLCTTSPVSAQEIFVPQIQAMGFMQSVFVAMANRVGWEVLRTTGTATEFLGSSCIVSPEGHVLACAQARRPEQFVAADLKADLLLRVRQRNQFAERRRRDTYLAEPLPFPDQDAGRRSDASAL